MMYAPNLCPPPRGSQAHEAQLVSDTFEYGDDGLVILLSFLMRVVYEKTGIRLPRSRDTYNYLIANNQSEA
jgi:hypothetical protein